VFKKYFWLIFLTLAALTLWQFSSVWVAQEINRQADQAIQLLEKAEGSYRWSLDDENIPVVRSFADHWKRVDGGLQARQEKSVLSLPLSQRFSTHWFSELHLDIDMAGAASMNIEVTNAESDVFFYAYDIALTPGEQVFNLSELLWYRQQRQQEWQDTDWRSIGDIASVVLQFLPAEAEPLTVQSVVIPQQGPIDLPVAGDIDCLPQKQPLPIGVYGSECHISNAMASLHKQVNLQNAQAFLKIEHPWMMYLWPLGIATVVLFFVCLLVLSPSAYREPRIWVLLFAMGVFLWAVHRPEAVRINQWYGLAGWVFGAFSLLIVFLIRNDLKKAFLQQTYRGWLIVLVPTLVIALVLALQAPLDTGRLLRFLPLYLLWAFLQQIILGPVVSSMLQKRLATSAFATATVSGFLFAVLHLPNQTLMLATWIAGTFWSWVWLTHKNLMPNVISHAVLALIFYQVVPDFYLHTARIGIRFVG